MAKNKTRISAKRLAIDNANAQMVIIVAVAAFVTMFCLMASKAVLSQNQYNARVMSAKQEARDQLKDNLETFEDLQKAYTAFDSTATNVIGGTTEGTGSNDGSNSKVVLDALPSTYDFPALTASLEKLFGDRNINISSITGTDDQVAQQANSASPAPQVVEIPFTVTINGVSYTGVVDALAAMQKSIRPMQIDTLEISGDGKNMTVVINGHTQYQPAKIVGVTKKVVK